MYVLKISFPCETTYNEQTWTCKQFSPFKNLKGWNSGLVSWLAALACLLQMQPSAVPQLEHLKRDFLHVTAFHPTKPTEHGGKLHGPSSYISHCLVCFFLRQVHSTLEEEEINPQPTHSPPPPPTHPYTQGELWGSQSLTMQIFIC